MINRVVNTEDVQQRLTLLDELHDLFRRGGVYEVTIVKKRRKATREQFGYFYSVVIPLAKRFLDDTQGGPEAEEYFSDDEADQWLKHHLRGVPVVNKKTGEQIGTVVPRKRDFSTKEMAEYVDDVVDFLKKQGVHVPPPDKHYRERLNKQSIREAIQRRLVA